MRQENLFISNFRFIIRVGIYIVIMLAIWHFTGKEYATATEHNIVNAHVKQRYEDFNALPENSLDMLFIGSSHSYCTFDPEIFDEALGTSSFQMGTPFQHPDTTYFSLMEIFKTQSPEVVVMELYWDVLDDDFDMRQASFFFDGVDDEEVEDEYIKTVFPMNEKAKHAVTPIRYQADYFAYKSSDMEKEITEKYEVTKKVNPRREGLEEYRSKGYTYCEYIILESEFDETNQYKGLDGEKWQFDKTQKKYLDLIVEFLDEQGTELIFVTAPVAPISMELMENYEDLHNTVKKEIAGYGKKYIDYNMEFMENSPVVNDNFQDDGHLNTSGAIIVCNLFVDYLLENADFFN